MKLTLQQTRSKLFFKNVGEWTEDPGQAYDFPTALSACVFSIHHGLTDVQLVEVFSCDSEQGKWDVHVLQDSGVTGHNLSVGV